MGEKHIFFRPKFGTLFSSHHRALPDGTKKIRRHAAIKKKRKGEEEEEEREEEFIFIFIKMCVCVIFD